MGRKPKLLPQKRYHQFQELFKIEPLRFDLKNLMLKLIWVTPNDVKNL